MSRYKFEEMSFDMLSDEFFGFRNKYIFTTKEWLEYVQEDSKGTPFILRITGENGDLLGYFTGFIIKKFGIKILGSPFSGWSSCFMGLDLFDRSEQYEIVKEIVAYVYKQKKVKYIEIIDRNFNVEEAIEKGFKAYPVGTLQLPIDMDDEALFKQMKTDCRNFIRQFERRGATLEIAEPDDTFAEDYYNQLIDVFEKQGMVPTYSREKVKCLLRHMKDSDNVLCLRVRNPEGESIATSIFFGVNNTFFFWGGASYRSQQHYRPNEYMIWTAIKYWRDKGFTTFDMVGIRDYKRKFGSHEEEYARLVFAKSKVLILGRDMAKKLYFTLLKINGLFKKKGAKK